MQRLEYMYQSARNNHRRASIIYMIAGILLIGAGYLAIEPLIALQKVSGKVQGYAANLRLNNRGGADEYAALLEIQQKVLVDINRIGERAELAATAFNTKFELARGHMLTNHIAAIDSYLAANNLQRAQAQLVRYRQVFGNELR